MKSHMKQAIFSEAITQALKKSSAKLPHRRTNNLISVDSVQEKLRPATPPLLVVHDNAQLNMEFNIMKDRSVKEVFTLKEYRIWNRYAEATLYREYFSSMRNIPNHLIFFTACAHSQKMLYLILCYEFGIEYKPDDSEQIKIWPTTAK